MCPLVVFLKQCSARAAVPIIFPPTSLPQPGALTHESITLPSPHFELIRRVRKLSPPSRVESLNRPPNRHQSGKQGPSVRVRRLHPSCRHHLRTYRFDPLPQRHHDSKQVATAQPSASLQRQGQYYPHHKHYTRPHFSSPCGCRYLFVQRLRPRFGSPLPRRRRLFGVNIHSILVRQIQLSILSPH